MKSTPTPSILRLTFLFIKKIVKHCLPCYEIIQYCLKPINLFLAKQRKQIYFPSSVLHISYLVHIPYYTVELLKREGLKADYLAIGTSKTWNKCDYRFIGFRGFGIFKAFQEFIFFWRIVAKYEIVHMHFMLGLSESGWELPLLKMMGRKIVVHYRGCEIRNREKNMHMHPHMNICQKCDYNASICTSIINKKRQTLMRKYGDLFLVTTPDMRDFIPEAHIMPFFSPEISFTPNRNTFSKEKTSFKIFHTTNHPGIEGTEEILKSVEKLRSKGMNIEFVFLKGVSHDEVLKECATADLAIGKMKMGFYANAQIESMALGVPTITYIRPEFITKELEESGFIICSLEELENTIEFYISHPEQLAKKRALARNSILKMHDNQILVKKLIGFYNEVNSERQQ